MWYSCCLFTLTEYFFNKHFVNDNKRRVRSMNQLTSNRSDINNIATWTKYSKKLCDHCEANCCSLPVEVKAPDLIRMGLMDSFELEENLKLVARRLMKQRLVDHFHSKTATFILSRMANGDCLYLDAANRRCTIYHKRPDTCRNHPQIGPRSGFCAFNRKCTS